MIKHSAPIAAKVALTCLTSILVVGTWKSKAVFAQESTHILTTAPVDTDIAGKNGDVASQSVFRLICIQLNSSGTGFLHKSGNIITAAHVAHGCPSLIVLLPDGKQVETSILAIDDSIDIAILSPSSKIDGPALTIASDDNLKVGTQVATWGFPGGYMGRSAMLSVGYLSSQDAVKRPSGSVVTEWVVNAAFNSGNSGGPLIQIETGQVIGIVSSKLAPLSSDVSIVLDTLQKQSSGMQYSFNLRDGRVATVSEAQIVGLVLNELRQQVQLVIGYAVLLFDIKNFLQTQGLDP